MLICFMNSTDMLLSGRSCKGTGWCTRVFSTAMGLCFSCACCLRDYEYLILCIHINNTQIVSSMDVLPLLALDFSIQQLSYLHLCKVVVKSLIITMCIPCVMEYNVYNTLLQYLFSIDQNHTILSTGSMEILHPSLLTSIDFYCQEEI